MSLRSIPADPHADLGAVLREHGLRVTAQRRYICEVFAGAESAHLTADEVFQRARAALPELSRATVYNALGELVEAGLLALVEGRGPQQYDSNVAPHHHFRCRRCHTLHDVEPDGVGRLHFSQDGFQVDSAHVLLEGLCPPCAQRTGEPAP